MVVICGRNQKLQERLRARPAGAGHPLLHVRGFVDNIHEWMGACDAIITKAGPGTIAEALIAGLPILLNGNVPCQVGWRVRGWGWEVVAVVGLGLWVVVMRWWGGVVGVGLRWTWCCGNGCRAVGARYQGHGWCRGGGGGVGV